MSLTAGAKLQNGKYLIRSVLHQTDASISYQATHTSLNHPVVIHTLNPSLQQSPRLDGLRQQFLATVKQGKLKDAIVWDCFEEDKIPYVVLEPTPTPIQLADSMPFLTAAVLSSTLSSTEANGNAAPVAAAIAPSAQKPPAQKPPTQKSPAQNKISAQPLAPQLPDLPAAIVPPVSPPPAPAPAPASPPRRRRWIPVALLLTAATAGLTGGAIGWRIRQGAATPSAPALFSREQPFPEKTDWLGEDPYADSDDGDDDSFDSASPAIERRTSTRQRRSIEPEPEYYELRPRSRSRRIDRSSPAPSNSRPRQPQAEDKPEAEAPKIETFSDPAPALEAPPPAVAPVAPVAPEPPAPAFVEPSPKVQLAPPDEPISQ